MKKLFAMLLIVAGCVSVPAETPAPAEQDAIAVPTVAVLPFDVRDRGAAATDTGKSVAELLTIALQETGCADLVERAELEKALNELHLSATGLTDRESQVKLGKFIGARILITGSLFKSGDKNYLVAKVIGTETTRVFGSSVNGSGEFTEMVPELAGKLAATLEKRTAQLLPKAEGADAVAAALAARVKGNNRKIFITVKEDIAIVVPDPAAENELKKLLLQLGFEVVNNRGDADFAIQGEAFAANAGTYQKFSSAAARVELEIYGKDKKLLAAGSSKETLAGATYTVAAKEAIAQATLRLSKELFGVLK